MTANRADDGVDGPAYWCARTAHSTLLGAYDGIETWTLTADALTDWRTQTDTSRHELLHHLLQEGTPWGRIGLTAGKLARAGVDRERTARLFRFCRSAARTVHEVFATTLSLGGADSGAQPDMSPEYRAFFELGNRIAAPGDWETRRHTVDAVLRLCMAPAGLDRLARRGLGELRIRDLDHPFLRPDDRLAAVLEAGVLQLDCVELGPESLPDDLAAFFDRVAQVLNRIGLPTLPVADIRVLMDRLDGRPAPSAREPGPADGPIAVQEADGVEHYQRQAVELRTGGPLKVSIELAEDAAATTQCLSSDDRIGVYALVLWCRADLLARQFVQPNALNGRAGHVAAIQSPGPGTDADGAVRLAVFETDDPAAAARLLPARGVWLTTAASLLDAPDHARSDGITSLYAIVDLPVYELLSHTWRQNSAVAWTEFVHEASLKMYVLAWKTAALPGVVWLHFATLVSRVLIREWFSAQPSGLADHRPDAFGDEEGDILAVVRDVMAAWWVIDQLGGREHG